MTAVPPPRAPLTGPLMKACFLLCLALASLAACAQDTAPGRDAPAAQAKAAQGKAAPVKAARTTAAGTPAGRAEDAIHAIVPKLPVDRVRDAEIAGFQEVIAGGQAVFVSDDGRYLFKGALYDLDRQRDLADRAMAGFRRELLKKVAKSDRIVFAPKDPKYTVSVFTDVECAYCRKLHSQVAEYNRLGIAIEYLAFPRMGLGSEDYRKMVSVWCAPDPKQALTDAKNDKPVPPRTCKTPVDAEYAIGQRAGLQGTPMIVAADGTELGGYLPPKQLREALDELARGDAPATPAGPTGSR